MGVTEIRFRVDPAPRDPVALDPRQRAVLDLPLDASAAVLGAPGSGKTTVLIELLADRVARRGWTADAALVLAPSRAGATRLRDAVALRLGVPTDGPRVRTVPSLAFELVTAAARLAGRPAPRLITGGEQDLDFATLLGERDGVDAVPWPPELEPRVRGLRAFRTELRELLGRATEHGLTPADVAAAGERSGRPEWVAAGRFLETYLDVIASARPDQFDPAELAQYAARAIADGTAGPRVDALRLVLVDDLQEATASATAVLRALAGRGIPVVAFGDPDVAANAFRGGEPTALGQLASRLGVPVRELVLDRVHRHGPGIRHLVSAVTDRIGTAAAGRQRAAAARPASAQPSGAPRATASAHPPVERITALSPAREAAAIARALREAHLVDGVPWNRMAVVVRSGGRVPVLARSLTLADVPTRGGSGGIALRDDGAARALLTLVDVGAGRAPLDAETAEGLLLGPFGGLDPLALRRLRRALRAEELAGGGHRPGTELVAEALGDPARLATIDSRSARKAARLAETLRQLRGSDGSIEDLLWLAWDRSGLAEPWRRQALGQGLGAAEANRSLDGVVALFTAAKRFAERRPDVPAAEFLAEVLDAEVPEDILLPRALDDAVLVATPSALVGVEVDLVVVAGLQQGVWPNPRPRGTLLSPQRLVAARDAAAEAEALDERQAVLHDELRMFALAVSRASRRVLLTAVANEEEQPSPLLRLGAAPGEEPLPVDPASESDSEHPRLPLTLRGTVGRLRRIAANPTSPHRADSAATLARLAAEGVPGADPAQWLGLLPVSTDRPLHEGDPVPVSPSGVDALEQSPLDWFLDQVAGGDPGTAANVGTIVHWAMETAGDPGFDAVWSAIESRWGELAFEAPWLAERQRRLTRVLAEGLSDYLTEFAGSGKTLVGAERRFRLELAEAVVTGSIDRVERAADGSVVIVDLKTGSAITKAEDVAAHPQLGSYQLAYASGVLDEALAVHGEHRGGGAKLLFVKSGVKGRRYREAVQRVFEVEQVEAARARLLEAARLIAAAEFRGLVELDDRGGMWDLSSYRLHRTSEVTSD
ncbi:MAG: ATP-dependent helicase [Micrococcales bacterium]|nr:ATP-dependent helicase [Micrococcales bacterium]